MVAFVDAHGDKYGVEPICKVLPIAPSTYYEHKARQADPTRLPPRAMYAKFFAQDKVFAKLLSSYRPSMAIPPQLQRKTEPAGPRWVYPRVCGGTGGISRGGSSVAFCICWTMTLNKMATMAAINPRNEINAA